MCTASLDLRRISSPNGNRAMILNLILGSDETFLPFFTKRSLEFQKIYKAQSIESAVFPQNWLKISLTMFVNTIWAIKYRKIQTLGLDPPFWVELCFPDRWLFRSNFKTEKVKKRPRAYVLEKSARAYLLTLRATGASHVMFLSLAPTAGKICSRNACIFKS